MNTATQIQIIDNKIIAFTYHGRRLYTTPDCVMGRAYPLPYTYDCDYYPLDAGDLETVKAALYQAWANHCGPSPMDWTPSTSEQLSEEGGIA